MEYRLTETRIPQNVIAVKDCVDDFAAEKWARDWATVNGKTDEYSLERVGGGFSAVTFKTVGGQWYVMRR